MLEVLVVVIVDVPVLVLVLMSHPAALQVIVARVEDPIAGGVVIVTAEVEFELKRIIVLLLGTVRDVVAEEDERTGCAIVLAR